MALMEVTMSQCKAIENRKCTITFFYDSLSAFSLTPPQLLWMLPLIHVSCWFCRIRNLNHKKLTVSSHKTKSVDVALV